MTPEQLEEFRRYMAEGMPEETYRKWTIEAIKLYQWDLYSAAGKKASDARWNPVRQARVAAARRALK